LPDEVERRRPARVAEPQARERLLDVEPEAGDRERLARAFLAGDVGAAEALPLLAAQRVRHVVLDAPVPAAEAVLAAAGFVRAPGPFGSYELWSR
jgi:hypothetical protein